MDELFKITTNQLFAVGSLDCETQSSYLIRVRATDQGQLSYEKPFVITATNVNEAPTALLLSNATIVEGAGANATVGVLSATDPDAGDTSSFSLVSGTGDTGNAAFAISGNQLRDNASLNQAAQSRVSVRVRGRDQGGLVFDQVFSITVTKAMPAFTQSVADRPEGESIDLLLSSPFAVSAPQSANASLFSLGGSRAASSHKPIADDFQPSRRLVDRQAIDRQAVDRSVADVDALFALWCDKA